MEGLYGIISKYGDGFIIIAGLTVLIFMVRNYNQLAEQKARIKESLERRNKKYRKNKDTHELDEEDDEQDAVTTDTIRAYENTFNALCSSHSALQQLITIFPLLGILGTVAGLMLSASAQGMEELANSLNTALGTTFFGLVASIILKAFDAVLPSKTINDVEVMLDDYDRKLDLADMFSNEE